MRCFLFCLFAEDQTSQQQDIDHDEENHNDDQCHIRLGGGHGGQQQNGDAEDHGGEILIHQIVSHRGLEIAVDLPEQDDAG